jgi:hypothetical protein
MSASAPERELVHTSPSRLRSTVVPRTVTLQVGAPLPQG